MVLLGRGGSDTVQRRDSGRIIGSKIIASKIKDRTALPDKKRGATMADVDRWAEEARKQGYTVRGSGWHRYKVRKHPDGRDMTRAEVKQQLIEEHGEFTRSHPKYRYVHFAGSWGTVMRLKKALKLPVLKYPKRLVVETSAPLQSSSVTMSAGIEEGYPSPSAQEVPRHAVRGCGIVTESALRVVAQ
jgi:hypothetical protein